MSRRLVFQSLFFLCLLVSTGCNKNAEVPIPKQFQGTWDVLNSEGKKLPNGEVIIERDTIAVTQMSATVGEAKSRPSFKATFTVNPAEIPAQIDFAYMEGTHMGKTMFGIYSFEDKKLKIAIAAIGQPRPTEFGAAPKITALYLEHRP